MINDNYLHSDTTQLILKAYYAVYNNLGFGFLEKVYENALLIELRKLGLACSKQCPIEVNYDDQIIGQYFADIIVHNSVIIEIKAAENICPGHECQLVNYLKATNIEVGLLLNFGKQPEFKRRVLTSQYKNLNVS
ncbi:MAG: GxxExxY protein [Bacteroidia bacterium]|nr:GxxExxY protein [Bacteroidia bacterium]